MLNPHAFQIGTFGTEVTTRPSGARPLGMALISVTITHCSALCPGEAARKQTEGSPPSRANLAPQPCIRLDPRGVRTMKQPFASAARLQGGGHILPTASKPWPISCHRHLGSSSAACRQGAAGHRNRVLLLDGQAVQVAGRSTTPSGMAPVVTMRHSSISSLRASATIMVVLRAPFAPSVRARYHCASALSFWNMRNRQASWISPRRTRALPDLASPFSRGVSKSWGRWLARLGLIGLADA